MNSMLLRAALVSVALIPVFASAQDVTGAGASFPAPIYSKWADAYNKATGARINYQSVGSGAGIKQIKSKTVDFGASDMPLTDEELAKDNLVQFPTVIGGVVPVVNIVGIKPGQIKLTGAVLGDIYLGKITKWNDAALTALNAGVPLPAADISVVRRADGSGTSFIFTATALRVAALVKEPSMMMLAPELRRPSLIMDPISIAEEPVVEDWGVGEGRSGDLPEGELILGGGGGGGRFDPPTKGEGTSS